MKTVVAKKATNAAECSTSRSDCPTTKVAEILSDTWTMLIMRALTEGPKRFGELEKWLDGISTRTLTLKLETLKKRGLIAKSREGIYESTEKGKGLRIIEKAMIEYSKKFL
jgi:DNA-binding HxlR family transcriptional regulator